MRLALLATVAFAGLWFIALKPKPVEEEKPAPAPAQLQAVDKAKDTVAGANAASAARERAAGGKAPAASAPTGPEARAAAEATRQAVGKVGGLGKARAARAADLRAVLQDLAARRVVVLLFWDREGADDWAAHHAVSIADRRKGKVRIHTAPIDHIADFEPITRSAPILQSPTVLVIDRNRRAKRITGLTEKGEVDDAVARALRAR
jgi:hypothetical protein